MNSFRSRRFSVLLPFLILSTLLCTTPEAEFRSFAATGAPSGAENGLPVISCEKEVLPNGIQLLLHADRRLPVVHVNQWFHVGSKDETPGRTGFAHLFEHMMFQGSQNASGEYFTHIEKAGANLREGGVNGTTGPDVTNYFATVPSGNLEYLLWLESDRVSTLLNALTAETLANQKEVVMNERRQGLENQPYGRVWEILPKLLYPAGHPYSWPVIGSLQDISNASLDEVKEFFRKYYTPNNLSIAITGDFDPQTAKALVKKYYGSIPPGPVISRPKRWVPVLDTIKTAELYDRVPQARLYLAWNTPAYFEPDQAELALAASILTDGFSSRLKKTLVYDRQLCTDIQAYPDENEIGGSFLLIATLRPETSFSQVKESIKREISRLARDGPTPAELLRTKNKRETATIRGLERIGGFGGKADILNSYNVFLGDPNHFPEDLMRFRRATPRGVKEAVMRWLVQPNYVEIRVVPETSSETRDIQPLDRSTPPKMGGDAVFLPPSVASSTLDNGLSVLTVEIPELPENFVLYVTRYGSAYDPPGKEGLANMVANLIHLGTRNRKALEIEDEFGTLGTSLYGGSAQDNSYLEFQALSQNLEPAFRLFCEVLRNPDFPPDEIERQRKRLLDGISQEEADPNSLSARLIPRLFFGPTHPLGHPPSGFKESLPRITREDLSSAHQSGWNPSNSALVLVGKLPHTEAVELARKNLGDWQGKPLAKPDLSAMTPPPFGRILVVDRPGSAQTVISQVMAGPPRQGSDFYSLSLADAVWGGGGFGTRLTLNLREKRGFTYRVRSYFQHFWDKTIWYATSGVQTARTGESLIEFLAELDGLTGARPVSSDELENARLTKIRGYPQKFETLLGVTSRVSELWLRDLPLTEFANELRQIQQLDLPSVQASPLPFAGRERCFHLLVGDTARFPGSLANLASGGIVLIDSSGKEIPQEKSR